MPPHYDVFISYRRVGGEDLASRVKDALKTRGFNPFMDIEGLGRGDFSQELLQRIDECPNFVLILTKDCLDRCKDESDWLRKEIKHALRNKEKLVPVLGRGFQMPTADSLPEDIRDMVNANGLEVVNELFEASIDRLASQFLIANHAVSAPKITSKNSHGDSFTKQRPLAYWTTLVAILSVIAMILALALPKPMPRLVLEGFFAVVVLVSLLIRDRSRAKTEVADAKEHILSKVISDWIRPFEENWTQPGTRVPAPRFPPKTEIWSKGEIKSWSVENLRSHSDERILILGSIEDGATLFLEKVVSSLVIHAQNNPLARVPVVLQAATWAQSNIEAEEALTLEGWVRSQLIEQYGLEKGTAEALFEDEELILCIEGAHQAGSSFQIMDTSAQVEGETELKIRSHFFEAINSFAAINRRETNRPGMPIIITCETLGAEEKLFPYLQTRVRVVPWSEDEANAWLDSHGCNTLKTFLNEPQGARLYGQLLRDLFTFNLFIRFHMGKEREKLNALNQVTSEEAPSSGDGLISECYYEYFAESFRHHSIVELNPWAKLVRFVKEGVFPLPKFETFEGYISRIAHFYGDCEYFSVFRVDELSPEHIVGSEQLTTSYRLRLGLRIAVGVMILAALPTSIGAWIGWALDPKQAARGIWSHTFNMPATPTRWAASALIVFASIALVGGPLAGFGYALAGKNAKQSARDSEVETPKKRRLFVTWNPTQLVQATFIGTGLAIGRFTTVAFSIPLPNIWPLSDAITQGIAFLIAAIPFFYFCLNILDDDVRAIKLAEFKDGFDFKRVVACIVAGSLTSVIMFATDSTHEPLRAVVFGIFVFALSVAFFARRTSARSLRVRPNGAIIHAFRIAITVAVTVAASCSVMIWVRDYVGWKDVFLARSDACEALFLMVFYYFLGGLMVAKHYALIGALRQNQFVPWRYLDLLSEAVDMRMLRRVGGGFTFPSKAVFEYFKDDRRLHVFRNSDRTRKGSESVWRRR